jgi:hypothetical protein
VLIRRGRFFGCISGESADETIMDDWSEGSRMRFRANVNWTRRAIGDMNESRRM